MSRLGEAVPCAGRATDQETKYALEDIRFARLEQSEEAKSSWVGPSRPGALCPLFLVPVSPGSNEIEQVEAGNWLRNG